jgi:predicted nucleic acid-binding protein
VFDTNVLLPLVRSARPQWRLLLDHSRARLVRLVVPELVWLELETVIAEQAAASQARWHKATAELAALGATPPQWPDRQSASEIAVSRVKEFRAAFERAGGHTAEMPAATHRDLVGRALARARPFDESGQKGYRDALVWETVIELATPADPVLLISNDAKAFAASKSGEELHPELSAEIKRRTSPSVDIGLVRDIAKAAEIATLSVEVAAALTIQILENDELVAGLMHGTAELLFGYELDQSELRAARWGPPVVAARIDDIDDLHGLDVAAAALAGDGDVTAEIVLGYTAQMTMMLEPDYLEGVHRHISSETGFEPQGRGLLDGYERANLAPDVDVFADAVFDPVTSGVKSIRINNVAISGATGPSDAQLRLQVS